MARSALLALVGAAAVVSGSQYPAQQPLNQPQAPLLDDVSADHPKPLVNTNSLQEHILSENLWRRAEKLYECAKKGEEEFNHPTRVIGSKGHLATLDYIKSELASLGSYYHVSEQAFGAVSGNVYEFRLVIDDKVPNSTTTMGLTPATAHKEPVDGQLVLVKGSGCKKSDYPANLKDNIAYIKRGECSFGDKSKLAGQAGAVAAVVYNTDPEEIHGTLGTPSPHHIATFGLSGTEGSEYAELLSRGKIISASAYIDADVDTIMTNNIIAETTHGDRDNCVMIGGHSDSVTEGPGINDDGSGSISVLEVAVQLAKYRVNNCVRFAWWAAEEEGLLGSDHYVATLSEKENLKIRVFMDYDMMASPNFAYQIYNATDAENPAGSQALRDLYIDWYKKMGLNYTFVPFDGRSDYDGFIRGGIPAGGIATGAEGVKTKEEQEMFGGVAGEWYDKNYHQIGDDLTNVNMTAWEVNTKLIAHSVATYAASFKGFPKRTKELHVQTKQPVWKYHGNKLVM